MSVFRTLLVPVYLFCFPGASALPSSWENWVSSVYWEEKAAISTRVATRFYQQQGFQPTAREADILLHTDYHYMLFSAVNAGHSLQNELAIARYCASMARQLNGHLRPLVSFSIERSPFVEPEGRHVIFNPEDCTGLAALARHDYELMSTSYMQEVLLLGGFTLRHPPVYPSR
jgi:hypothetical protein